MCAGFQAMAGFPIVSGFGAALSRRNRGDRGILFCNLRFCGPYPRVNRSPGATCRPLT